MIDAFEDEYRFLSNFWMVPVEYDGEIWPSTEHAYQAAKTDVLEEKKKIQLAVTANETKKLGRKVTIKENWDDIKLQIMRDIVTAKFKQHPDLAKILKETGDQELIEGNWWGDTYWGVCRGKGTNHLGKILMEIRAKL